MSQAGFEHYFRDEPKAELAATQMMSIRAMCTSTEGLITEVFTTSPMNIASLLHSTFVLHPPLLVILKPAFFAGEGPAAPAGSIDAAIG